MAHHASSELGSGTVAAGTDGSRNPHVIAWSEMFMTLLPWFQVPINTIPCQLVLLAYGASGLSKKSVGLAPSGKATSNHGPTARGLSGLSLSTYHLTPPPS